MSELFTKKLVEKDVEVTETITRIEKRVVDVEVKEDITRTEKQLIDVYVFEGKEYEHKWKLRGIISHKMGTLLSDSINTAREKRGLAHSTQVRTLTNQMKSQYGRSVFDDGSVVKNLPKILELSEILAQIQD